MKSTVITDLTPAAIAELLASFTSAGAAKVLASAPAAAVAAAAKVLGSAKGKTAAAPAAAPAPSAPALAPAFVAGSLPAGWNVDRRTKSQWPPGGQLQFGFKPPPAAATAAAPPAAEKLVNLTITRTSNGGLKLGIERLGGGTPAAPPAKPEKTPKVKAPKAAAAAPKAAAAAPPPTPKAPAGPSPGEAPRMGEAEIAACQVAQTRSPTWEKVEAAAAALGLTGVKFWRVRGDYYDQELAWRRDVLGAATTAQLCKAMIMENTKLVDLTAEAAAAQGRVKYACVVLQYDGPKLNKEKMTDLVRKMEGKAAVGKKQYNMRMVSEEANLTLSGFEHNAVTPVGMAQRMPIIVSAPLAAFEEMWLGAGEVDLKLKVNVQQFVAAYKKAEGCGAAFGDVVG